MKKTKELKETVFEGNEVKITVQTPIVKKLDAIVSISKAIENVSQALLNSAVTVNVTDNTFNSEGGGTALQINNREIHEEMKEDEMEEDDL